MVVLHALRVDTADFHLRHAEGTESAADVVEVDDIVVREVGGLGFANGADIGLRTVLADERGVAGADAAGAGTVTLEVLDAHPPGVERGVEERSALPHGEVTGGEREDDQVTGGGAHGSILPYSCLRVSNWARKYFRNILAKLPCPIADAEAFIWYNVCMSTTPTNNHEHEHFPCDCHRPEYAYDDRPCPSCEEQEEREREAKREARKAQDDAERDADNQAFIDAASRMSREDWDADNDWLASAGWGEM